MGPLSSDRFLDTSLLGLRRLQSAARQVELSGQSQGPLQRLHPQAKFLLAALWLFVVMTSGDPVTIWGLALLCLSGCCWLLGDYRRAYLRQALPLGLMALVFGLPALFFTPGQIWRQWGWFAVTESGMASFLFLTGRSLGSLSLVLWLIFSTPWTHLLQGMRRLGIPALLVALLAMTMRYIFLLLDVATRLLEARRARVLGPFPYKQRSHLAATLTGALLTSSMQTSEGVHRAMVARGFRGDFYSMATWRWRWQEGLFCAAGSLPPLLLLLREAM